MSRYCLLLVEACEELTLSDCEDRVDRVAKSSSFVGHELLTALDYEGLRLPSRVPFLPISFL